ncbi:MAG: flagellar biosynthesis protein FlhB [Methylococcaceae bacterium TMED69]|nr:MAG: flagellar biosynthesis protein FlhB [Methylococcaceae bacterium TMED69]|tara:strand:+ start:411 stop:1559 length:1149 start_codon:yes stop_codon:yes gene_type:complete
MAENDSTEERTEEPTAKRLEKARSEGRVARSQELSVAAMLIGTSIFLYFMGGYFVENLAEEFAAGFVFDRKLVFSDNLAFENLISLGLKSFFVIVPIFALTFIIATIAAGAIGGFVLSFEALAPKLSKINPIEGIKRIFGLRAVIELIKALAKFLLIGGVLVFVLSTSLDSLIELGFKGLKPALSEAGSVIATGMLWVTIPLIVVASIDVPYQIFEYKKKLKMTKQEIKDELKETEGRPEVRAQIRRKQREMAMGRMIDAVAEADVIITNPSEFAVALSYNPGTEEAPQLIAKGVDLIASQIRDKAKENGVPVFASPLLARALYFTTDVNEYIPESLYYAVAQVIAYVFNLQSVNMNQNRIDKPNPEIPKEFHFDPSGNQLI